MAVSKKSTSKLLKRKLDSVGPKAVKPKKAKVEEVDDESDSFPEFDGETDDLDGSEEEESESDGEDEDELDGGSSSSEDDEDEEEEDKESEDLGSDEHADVAKTEEEKEKARQSREEQKKLKLERKLGRQNGVKIQDIKKIWEKLRVKSGLSSKERQSLVDEAWELCHDCVKELVFKHDASRVVQTIFKHSDKKKRQAITKELKGSYVELAKSSYGKYLLVKLLHYGTKEVREDVINEMHGHFRKLMRHKEGAYVIEDAYRDYSTAAQKAQIVREFYGSEYALFREKDNDKKLKDIIAESPDKRPFLMANLKGVIASAVHKGSIGFTIIHAAMLEYVKNIDPQSSEREEFIDLISEQFAEIVHTNEGSQVACIVLSIATAKERKGLVRTLKPFVAKMAEDEFGYQVLITLFGCVDDTVLVAKSFLPDVTENISKLITSKNGRRPFLYLFLGLSPRYFIPSLTAKFAHYDELKKNTSKKDDIVRRQELNKAFSPIILKTIRDNVRDILSDSLGAQFVGEALLFAHGVDEDRAKTAEVVAEAFETSPDNEKHLIHNPFSGRLLRALIQEGHWNAKEKKVEQSSESPIGFKSMLLSRILESIDTWATGEGSFAVLALIENLESEDKAKLLGELKKAKKAIKAETDNKGSVLILGHL